MRGLCHILLFFLVLAIPLSFGIDVSTCQAITSPGEYNLTANLDDAGITVTGIEGTSEACLPIQSDGVILNCNGYQINNDGSTYSAAIAVNGSSSLAYRNIVVRNCPRIYDYENGIIVQYGSNVSILNTTAYSDYHNGILFNATVNSTIFNTTAYYNFERGIHLCSSNNNTVANSIVHGQQYDQEGIYINSSSGNRLENNTVYSNYQQGIQIASGSSYNTLINNTVHTNNRHGIYLRYDSIGNVFINNSIHNNSDVGIYLTSGSGYNSFTGNSAYDGEAEGVKVESSNNNFTDNNISDNQGSGVYVYSGYGNTLSGNTISFNCEPPCSAVSLDSLSGGSSVIGNNISFNLDVGLTVRTPNNTIANNTIYQNLMGIWVSSSSGRNNTIANNSIYNNTDDGVLMDSSASNNSLAGNTLYNNTYGIRFYSLSTNNTLTGNTAYNNTYGIYIRRSTNNTFYYSVLYSNGYDLYLENSNYTLIETYLLPPSGTFANYTNLSTNDVMAQTETYSINWSASPGSSPAFMSPFENKCINITAQAGTPSIDFISWHWDESELSGHSESLFGLWKYNSSGWTLLNDTPDTTSNALTLYDMSPASIYGLFEPGISECQAITSPGEYNLTTDLSGAGITTTGMTWVDEACIAIQSDNVTLDCNGHTITNNGTLDAAGIASNGSSTINYTNITIRNCPGISGYEFGIYAMYTENGVFFNNTAFNSSDSEFHLSYSPSNTLANNTAYSYDSNYYGFHLHYSPGNTLANNTAFNNSDSGFYLAYSPGNTLTNNTAYINYHGFGLYYSSSNTLANNTAYEGYDGFELSHSSSNTLANNTAFNNSERGFYLYSSSNYNTLANNTVHENDRGFYLQSGSSYNNFTNNTVYDNLDYGFFFSSSHNNTLTDNTVYDNPQYGIYLYLSSNSTLAGNHVYNNNFSLGIYQSNYTMQDTFFLNPYGTYENYTSLSISDVVGSGEGYSVNWSASPGSPPEGRASFENKYLDITNLSSTAVSIDSISWHWDESESSGHDESAFELWKYNASGWTLLNDTPDTSSNALSQYNMDPASIYGIFSSGISSCQAITSPGEYTLTANLDGAGVTITGISGTNEACIAIQSDNVTLDCNGFTIANNGTSSAAGIAVNGSSELYYSNITIENCPNISAYEYAIRLKNVTYSAVRNITNYDSTVVVGLVSGYHNEFSSLNDYGSQLFASISGSYNNLTGSASDNAGALGEGIYLSGSYNRIVNNSHNGGWWTGMDVSGNYHVISGNNLSGSMTCATLDTQRSTFSGNLLYCALDVDGDNNTIEGNELLATLFTSPGGDSNNITNNTIHSSTSNALEVESDNNLIVNNTFFNNSAGVYVYSDADNNLFENNSVYNNSDHGFYIYWLSDYNRFVNNTVYDNTYGFYVRNTCNYNNITGNSIFNNSGNGITVNVSSSFNNIAGNEIYGNLHGISLEGVSNNTISNSTLYSNVYDFYSKNSNYTMETCTFPNPAGTFSNYTNLSVQDVMAETETYSINWSASPGSNPAIRNPFENKYLNMTTQAGTPAIDSITWHWLQSESSGYEESAFELWKFNASGWTLLNDTPQISFNTLSQYNMNPAGIYGLFEDQTIMCGAITSPGAYTLTENLTGAGTPITGMPWGDEACIAIQSSDVILDCNGYNISNGASPATRTAIAVNGSATTPYSNITIRNCHVEGYGQGISLNYLFNSTLDNNTVGWDFSYGIRLSSGSNNNITNNTATGHLYGAGIYLDSSSSHNNLANNTLLGNSDGIRLSSSNNNSIRGTIAYGNSIGIRLSALSSNNTLADNTIHNNTDRGIYLYSSFDNTVSNSTLYNNTYDLYLRNSSFTINYARILNPSGTFANYTNLSIVDTQADGEQYSIAWSASPGPSPLSRSSFENKYLNITNQSGTASINSITWTWEESELPGYAESFFELWKYNSSGWALINDTPDTSSNIFAQYNLNPASIYALFEFNDSDAPQISLTSPDEGYAANESSLDFVFTATDNIYADFNCSIQIDGAYNQSNSSTLNNTPTSFTVPSFADGAHNWSITCTDNSSNSDSSETRNFTVDTVAPALAISSPANTTYATNNLTVNYTTDGTSCSLFLDGAANQSLSSCENTTLSNLTEAQHYVTIYSNDSVNNTNSSTVYFTVDTTPPAVSISAPTNTTHSTNNLSVDYTTDGVSCLLVLDGTSNVLLPTCGNTSLSNLSDGQHYVTIYANDSVNNTGSGERHFTVDISPPTVTITSPANTTYTTAYVSLAYSASDTVGVASCWFYLNGTFNSTLDNCTGTTIANLSLGQYYVTVYANDSLNNTGSDEVYFTIVEDSGGGDDDDDDEPDYECITSSDCSECEICSGHECVLPEGSCNSASDCSGEYPFYECEECSCTGYECETSDDCGEGYACEEGECIPPECFTDEDCGEGYLCEDYECFLPECIEDEDCPGEGETCEDYECVPPECLTLEDCPDGYTCGNYTCIPPECFTDEDCEEGYVCEDYNCTLWVCQTSADCGEGFVCEDGVCLQETTPTGTGGTPSGSPSGGAGGIGSHSIAQPEGPTLSEQFGIAQFALPLVEGDILEELLPEMSVEEREVVGTGALFFAILAIAVIYALTHKVGAKRRRRRPREQA